VIAASDCSDLRILTMAMFQFDNHGDLNISMGRRKSSQGEKSTGKYGIGVMT